MLKGKISRPMFLSTCYGEKDQGKPIVHIIFILLYSENTDCIIMEALFCLLFKEGFIFSFFKKCESTN